MNQLEAISARHSVRSFTDKPLSSEVRAQLQAEIDAGNAAGGLHMQLVCDEPEAFNSAMAHYGKFSGVSNYVILAGPAASDLEERCGYYGERIVLLAQQLGLKSCWVALTFKRRAVKKMLAAGDKLAVVIALGYADAQGASHKLKEFEQVSATAKPEAPAWYQAGIEAALLAPTAMNQQKFRFELAGAATGAKPAVKLTSLGGAYSSVDLGIVKLHFEVGAGTENFVWA